MNCTFVNMSVDESRRKTSQPTSVLTARFERTKSEIQTALDSIDVERTVLNIEELKNCRNELKIKWNLFEECFYLLQENLNSVAGATAEANVYKSEIIDLRKAYTNKRHQIKQLLITNGATSVSTRSSCDDMSGVSRDSRKAFLTEQLITAKTKSETQQKLAVLEVKQRELDLKAEQEKQKLKNLKEALITEGEIRTLEAQLHEIAASGNVSPYTAFPDGVDSKISARPPLKTYVNDWLECSDPENPIISSNAKLYSSPNTAGSYQPTGTAGVSASPLVTPNVAGSPSRDVDAALAAMTSSTPAASRATSRFAAPRTSVTWADDRFSPVLNSSPIAQSNRLDDINEGHSAHVSLDAATRHLALIDLKRVPPCPFKGDAHDYHAWIKCLQTKMNELKLTSIEKIEVLEAHTVGKPREVIKTFRNAYGYYPDMALKTIYQKLEKRFGADTEIAAQLRARLEALPAISGTESDPNVAVKLRQMSDLCLMVSAHMDLVPDLQTLNYAHGLQSLRKKLPEFMNNRWRTAKDIFNSRYGCHPNFDIFCNFLEEKADTLCSDLTVDMKKDPKPHPRTEEKSSTLPVEYHSLQTSVVNEPKNDSHEYQCCVHRSNSHRLSECTTFADMNLGMRRLFLRSHQLCYKCLAGDHLASSCSADVSCDKCKATNHITIMHYSNSNSRKKPVSNKSENTNSVLTPPNSLDRPAQVAHADEPAEPADPSVPSVPSVVCTSVCGLSLGRNCSKTILVEVSSPKTSERIIRAYAMIDEQSTTSFSSPSLLDALNIQSPVTEYSLRTLSGGRAKLTGRVTSDLIVRGVTETESFNLSLVWENDHIPDTKCEVASSELLLKHPTLNLHANKFAPYDAIAKVDLLIGRDSGPLMATTVLSETAPYLHKTPIGFAYVGAICPSHSTPSNECTTLRTHIEHEHFSANIEFPAKDIFRERRDDDASALSCEDKKFLNVVCNNITVGSDGKLQIPLPIRDIDGRIPRNDTAVYNRQKNSLIRLKSNPTKMNECIKFMEKLMTHKHIERVPISEIDPNSGDSCEKKMWYLPLFPVTHPKKKKTRMVFDAAASYKGVSLNSMLLTGPDQNNKLRGVLCRFREQEVAFIADVECMFHSFMVPKEFRDYLRFYWFEDNDVNKCLVPYRARVHIFGASSSPAIATIGLRAAAKCVDSIPSDDDELKLNAKKYIYRNFYVDDGCGSAPSVSDAISILDMARTALAQRKVRLHKIVSNRIEVVNAFPESERGAVSSQFQLDDTDTQRTLGVAWKSAEDTFTMQVNVPERPFTKRGILAVINSIYDPIGFAAPVVLGGRLIQRKLMPRKGETDLPSDYDWDDILPEKYVHLWRNWISSLDQLNNLEISRCFIPPNFGTVVDRQIHVFTDAAESAIGHVIYMRSVNSKNDVSVSFVVGDGKVAPKAATSMPRLELCAAVNAALAAEKVIDEMDLKPNNTYFYSDSKVVLAYLNNKTSRFTNYVARRVEMIHRVTAPEQWSYVESSNNPADLATRPLSATSLLSTAWLTGPAFLKSRDLDHTSYLPPNIDLPESQDSFVALTTGTAESDTILGKLMSYESLWKSMVERTAVMLTCFEEWHSSIIMKHNTRSQNKENIFSVQNNMIRAEKILIQDAQSSSFSNIIKKLEKNEAIPQKHPLIKLSPFMREGILRVGGRLKKSNYPLCIKHPIILPHDHPISKAVLHHYHERVFHQGRVVTHGAIMEAGYYIPKIRHLLRKMINSCVRCRRLRAACESQYMADLPKDRMEPAAPFTSTGVDVFGPWMTAEGASTRRTCGTKKMWAALFTCMVSRAVHIELIPSLDTPTFINALRRFLAIRGPCKLFRSDRGTNFIGTTNQNLDMELLTDSCKSLRCTWEYNPPHSSHMGGSWERKIGQVRRALDGVMLGRSSLILSRDELQTLLQEAANVVNSTPLWNPSSDPEDPQPLSPHMLLTLKEPIVSLIPISETDSVSYGKRRWKRVQFLANEFWKLWQTSYLSSLHVRQKWLTKQAPLKPGDVVLLKDAHLKRNQWPTAVVDEVKHSTDKLVRSLKLRVAKKCNDSYKNYYYERPITDVVLLFRR